MSVRFSLSVLFSLVILNNVFFTQGLEEGESCSFNDGSKGVCKFLTDCSAALALLEQGKFPEKICGFKGTESIVCCNAGGESPTPTQRPTATTTTTRRTPKPTPKPTTKPTSVTLNSRSPGDKSNEKCKEYAIYAYNLEPSPIFTVEPQYAHTLECPFDKLELIVGGTLASRQEFPHMALLGYKSGSTVQWLCGGSLISERYILTAGHCLKHRQLGAVKYVRVGMTNQSDTNHMQEIAVSDVIRYPEYTNQRYHDIGLLRLEQDAELNIYVRPACLQTQKNIPTKKAIASGWGNIEFSGRSSNDLLKVVLEFFSTDKCNATYTRDIQAPGSSLKNGILEDTMICAGSHQDFKDTCQGDSGGPLQIYHEETKDIKCMYDIIGVTSFGKSCGLAKNVPGVYTRVSAYLKWIEDTVWP